jgi:hypothetical protein
MFVSIVFLWKLLGGFRPPLILFLTHNVHGGAFVHGAAFVHARDLRCNHPPEDHSTTTTAPNAIEN